MDYYSEEELRTMVADCWSMRELCRKIGYASNGNNNKTVQQRLDKYNISTEHFTGMSKKSIKRTPENVFIQNSTATQAVLRRMYQNGNYSEYKCAICGLDPVWNNQPLVLTLDHINGDNHDDRLENLRWICPNCDRQLDTFAGKNVNHDSHKKTRKNLSIIVLIVGVQLKLTQINAQNVQQKIKELLNGLLKMNYIKF